MNDTGLDKAGLIAGFNAAAAGYDAVAGLQKYVGDQLLDRLDMMKISARKILDLGSGTGSFSRILAKRYPAARIIQADIAENMLRMSRSKSKRFFSRQSYVCADAEQIPLVPHSTDMVFSNLMLQWSHDLDRLFTEVFRISSRNGLFIFSTFGPDTLNELRECWARTDRYVHVNSFADMHDVGDALVRTGFADPVMETDYMRVDYDDVYALMRDLKNLGAHNVNMGRRRSLTGKNRFIKMQQEYEKLKKGGKLPATYELIFGHAWMPAVHSRKTADGTVSIPVDVLRKAIGKGS